MPKRDIGLEILESIQAIKRGEGKTYTVDTPTEPKIIRERMKLEPMAFASLFGVSLRTLRYWEQGKRKPSKAAKFLLLIAAKRPEVLLEVLKEASLSA